jgi:hypothetical protein
MTMPTNVFFDANVIIGQKSESDVLTVIEKLVRFKVINIITTDHTITEIACHRALKDYELLKNLSLNEFKISAKTILNLNIDGDFSESYIKSKCIQYRISKTKNLFDSLNAKILKVDTVSPSDILTDYARREGFFASDSKKNQFPDAFIFATLSKIITDYNPLIIVSCDKDFDNCDVKKNKNITLLSSIDKLYNHLNLLIDASPDLLLFFNDNLEQLAEVIQNKLSDDYFQVDVEDAEIEEVQRIYDLNLNDIKNFESLTIDEHILVICEINFHADLYYRHPDWETAVYDSEDKVLIPWADEVSGITEQEFNLTIQIRILTDNSGNPSEFDNVDIISGDLIVYLY